MLELNTWLPGSTVKQVIFCSQALFDRGRNHPWAIFRSDSAWRYWNPPTQPPSLSFTFIPFRPWRSPLLPKNSYSLTCSCTRSRKSISFSLWSHSFLSLPLLLLYFLEINNFNTRGKFFEGRTRALKPAFLKSIHFNNINPAGRSGITIVDQKRREHLLLTWTLLQDVWGEKLTRKMVTSGLTLLALSCKWKHAGKHYLFIPH